jgi:hypothetical protein
MVTSRPLIRAWRRPAMAILLLSLACNESVVTPSQPRASDPTLAAALRATMTGAAVEDLAYVALDPGTIAAGTSATISDLASGVERAAAIVNGGFDPVGIPANNGDTLVVSVATAAGQVVVASVVARPHPPHVVRVDPPKDQVDVPVNTNLTVVFNEPVNVGTLTSATMQLRRGATTVPGTIAVAPATPWLATFTPAQPLVSATTYTFLVTEAIADSHGLTLDSPVAVSFVTEVETADTSVASVVLAPLVSAFSGSVQLTAIAKDVAGNTLTGHSFLWTSSDASLASVDSTGLVTAATQASGTVVITAATGGRSGTATLNIDCYTETPGSACTRPDFHFSIGTRTVTGTISKLMPDGTTRPMPHTAYYAWIRSANIGGGSTGWRRSDANGGFRIDSVPDGEVAVMAGADQPCMAAASTVGRDAVINVTIVDPANPLPELTTTAPAVTGTVYRFANGVLVPVAGAFVQFSIWDPDLVFAETVTDSKGRYAMCNLQFSFADLVGTGFISAVAPEFRNTDKSNTIAVSGPGLFDIVVP